MQSCGTRRSGLECMENEKNVVCTHQYAWGDDLQKARYGVEKIRCNECGNFFEIKIRQEKIVCHGYND